MSDDVQQEMREMEAESSPKQSTSGAAGDTGSDGATKGLLMILSTVSLVASECPDVKNDSLIQSGTWCFIAVPIWQQWASNGYMQFQFEPLTKEQILNLYN